jgi:hypothetical protein
MNLSAAATMKDNHRLLLTRHYNVVEVVVVEIGPTNIIIHHRRRRG